ASTLAPETTAPLWSVTTPAIIPYVDCPYESGNDATSTTMKAAILRSNHILFRNEYTRSPSVQVSGNGQESQTRYAKGRVLPFRDRCDKKPLTVQPGRLAGGS